MKKTAIDIIKKIHFEVEHQAVSQERMLKEVKMMQFKIRPITGDISVLSSLHHEVVESLWKIGKIDEIISHSIEDLEEGDQNTLLDYLKRMELKTQDQIRDSLEKMTNKKKKRQLLKLEVFKDLTIEPIVN